MNFLTAMMVIAASGMVNDGQPTDYKTAYQNAQAGDKPLLILVTADWCPPCQVMKTTTIPQLMKKKAFKDFHYATVDYDRESGIAHKLIGDRGIPQLIMYEKKDGKWIRRYLSGINSPEKVEAFVARAASIRTADASVKKIEK